MKTMENQLEIIDLDFKTINIACESLVDWQKRPNFNNFLKEGPMCIGQNIAFLSKKLGGKKVIAKIGFIREKVAGIIWLHSFNSEEGSLEGSFRVNPDFTGKGIVTELTKNATTEALKLNGVEKVEFWHSAENKGSFFAIKKAGGIIEDFVEQQTFLPNLGKTTDDFKWKISEVCDGREKLFTEIINSEKKLSIVRGLRIHNLIDGNMKL